jgi:hypothetical protein
MGFEAGSDGFLPKSSPGRADAWVGARASECICNKEVIQHMIYDDLLHHRRQDVPREAYGGQGTGRSA